MALPIVEKIGQASKAAWPEVSRAMAINVRTTNELAEISDEVVVKVEEYIARGDGAPVRRRKICEETVWVLASLGWLRTGPERDVVSAAKALVDGLEDHSASDDELAQLEDQLTDVVRSLPEFMTTTED